MQEEYVNEGILAVKMKLDDGRSKDEDARKKLGVLQSRMRTSL